MSTPKEKKALVVPNLDSEPQQSQADVEIITRELEALGFTVELRTNVSDSDGLKDLNHFPLVVLVWSLAGNEKPIREVNDVHTDGTTVVFHSDFPPGECVVVEPTHFSSRPRKEVFENI